jgi:hypothetical protein
MPRLNAGKSSATSRLISVLDQSALFMLREKTMCRAWSA